MSLSPGLWRVTLLAAAAPAAKTTAHPFGLPEAPSQFAGLAHVLRDPISGRKAGSIVDADPKVSGACPEQLCI